MSLQGCIYSLTRSNEAVQETLDEDLLLHTHGCAAYHYNSRLSSDFWRMRESRCSHHVALLLYNLYSNYYNPTMCSNYDKYPRCKSQAKSLLLLPSVLVVLRVLQTGEDHQLVEKLGGFLVCRDLAMTQLLEHKLHLHVNFYIDMFKTREDSTWWHKCTW